jgi:GAG-pre-integrase domain
LAKTKDFELWNKRLGHPAHRTLNSLFYFNFEKNMKCDICKLAKLTRPPFSLSLSKSNGPFELIHPMYEGRPRLVHITILNILSLL